MAKVHIIYSYKYLESDLIKHCHVIFIHSLGQPLIVRSHSKVHRSRGNPKEIPTWASNYSYLPWFNKQQTWGRCRRRRNFICERSELFMVKNVYLVFSSHGFTYWWIYFFSAHCKHVPCSTLTHSTNVDILSIKRKSDAKSRTLSRTSDITETGNPCVILKAPRSL